MRTWALRAPLMMECSEQLARSQGCHIPVEAVSRRAEKPWASPFSSVNRGDRTTRGLNPSPVLNLPSARQRTASPPCATPLLSSPPPPPPVPQFKGRVRQPHALGACSAVGGKRRGGLIMNEYPAETIGLRFQREVTMVTKAERRSAGSKSPSRFLVFRSRTLPGSPHC